ncbi:MAG TPA: hypothetical protein VMR74_01395 [Gammaproteobacteria bacterium]|nr:hypothetical protein [Gammaproteobacteria bacterium]
MRVRARRRPRPLDLRLLVPLTAAASLSSCALTGGRQTGDYAVEYLDWGVERATGTTSAELTNIVQQLPPSDREDGALVYLTGGEGGVDSESLAALARETAAPERIVAEAVAGEATVHVRANRGSVPDRPSLHAASVAAAIDRLTTEIWPAEIVSVIVDIHVMPDDAVFSLARRVEWRDGDAFRLAVFRPVSSTAQDASVHELYHLLAARWSIGRRDARAAGRPNAASAYEEIAASLYADCGALLADGRLNRPTPGISGTLNGRRIEHPMSTDDLGYVLDMLGGLDAFPRETHPGTQFGLAPIPLLVIFGSEDAISADSAQGRALLSLCRDVGADPWRLAPWFARFREDA